MTKDVAGHRDPGQPVTDRGHSGPPGQGNPPTSQTPGLGFPADPGLVNRPTPLAWAAPHGKPARRTQGMAGSFTRHSLIRVRTS
jgi:hypothetical protein